MYLKDTKTQKQLTKPQQVKLENKVKKDILAMFSLTKENAQHKDKRALLIDILNNLVSELGQTTVSLEYDVYTKPKYSVISQIKTDSSNHALSFTNFKVSNIVILSTSSTLEAFEELLNYITQYQPQLEPTGDVYYIVPFGDNDFVLYRYGLDILAEQHQTLVDAKWI